MPDELEGLSLHAVKFQLAFSEKNNVAYLIVSQSTYILLRNTDQCRSTR